jgi:hypothetical protein
MNYPMHPQNLVGLKDLMAHVYEKFGPEAVVLEVVQDPGSHPEGCGCMECMEGDKYMHEFFGDEEEYEGPGEMHREEHAEEVSNDMSGQIDEMVGELRQASETHAGQAARLQNIAAALKSMGD